MPIIRLDIPQELATRLWQIDVDAAHTLELGFRHQMIELLEKNRREELTPEEEHEWEHYEYWEHLVRLAKPKNVYTNISSGIENRLH